MNGQAGANGRTRRGWGKPDLLALLLLTLAVLLVYSKVLFTNLVPASGDFLAYFVPYWDYVNEALRSLRLPLWNPYMFAGAPLQANPQTQIFYPLRWLFLWFPAEKGILYFGALHAWLAGFFAYALARRAARVGALAGLVAALIFALNGWTTGLLLQPVRSGTIAWLPAAILLWEMRPQNERGGFSWDRRTRRWLAANVVVWSLALLAGHSQTFYNQAVIFAVWVLVSILWQTWTTRSEDGPSFARGLWHLAWPVALILVVIFALTALLGAVQLLPTFELTTQSYRSGGLSFREHAALSLPPWRLGFTLLPHYARDLGQALGSDAFGEWVAYIGVVGILLALAGLFYGPRRIRVTAVTLVVMGVALALGGYNPLSYVLHLVVPGWNLFRVPARWLEAAVLGAALLAALGAENLLAGWRPSLHRPRKAWRWLAGAAGILLILAIVLLTQPNIATLAGWVLALLLFGLVLWGGGETRRWGVVVLVGVLGLELYAASWGLPIQHPTAPQAIRSWRTAPARIAAAGTPDCRTLSLSTITYDPGDLDDLRRIYGPYLDEKAFTDLVVASKAKEILAPNLGLLFRLPSLDGFGGGVLPTERFVRGMELFLPPERVVADGRLREQLHEIPDARLLSLFGVCYVIADKQFDVWHNGVYYDLAFGEPLTAAQPDLRIDDLPTFPVTAIGLVSHLQGGAQFEDGAVVGEVLVTYENGEEVTLPIRAGIETAEGVDALGLAHSRNMTAVRWRFDAPGQDAIAQLSLPESGLPAALDLRLLDPDVTLFVRGLAFIDEVSGAHATPPLSRAPWRRIHSGDVKVYENGGVHPRALLVPEAISSPDDDATLARMQDADFDPARTVLLAEGPSLQGGAGAATVVEEGPEQMRVRVEADRPGTLLIADAWYPGWEATLNGEPAPVLRADLLLRAVQVPAGRSDLILRFRPVSLRLGLILSLFSIVLLILLFVGRVRD